MDTHHLTPKVGLLPFFLELYDQIRPEMRDAFHGLLDGVTAGLQARGVEVTPGPICRLDPEFREAISDFEKEGVSALVSLHLAYSPSLESIGALKGSSLPLIVLDTTLDADFGLRVPPSAILLNHGVHGVMDMTNILRRHHRHFEIVAGHWQEPSTLDRVAALARAAAGARSMGQGKALRVGPAFKGMGDFSVEPDLLRERFGLEVTEVGLDALDAAIAEVENDAVKAEVEADRSLYAIDEGLDAETHRTSVEVGLGLRKLLDDGAYQCMSVNFQAFDSNQRPSKVVPFLEISKAMARGIGYGGEGDVLTAMLVGALSRAFHAVTFTEIFCADWSGGNLFLSHMGEVSPAVAGSQPLLFKKAFPFAAAEDPAVLTCPLKPGNAVFVDLAPGPDDTFSLIVAPVEVLAEKDALAPGMDHAIRGWIRPAMPVARFLERYAKLGGTHHHALVLGVSAEAVAAFGRFAGLPVEILD